LYFRLRIHALILFRRQPMYDIWHDRSPPIRSSSHDFVVRRQASSARTDDPIARDCSYGPARRNWGGVSGLLFARALQPNGREQEIILPSAKTPDPTETRQAASPISCAPRRRVPRAEEPAWRAPAITHLTLAL